MPIPQPNSGESQDDFINRCMGDETMASDYPDTDQRYAVCIDQTKSEAMKRALEEFRLRLSGGSSAPKAPGTSGD